MVAPKVSGIVFGVLAIVDLYANSIPDPNTATLVHAGCRLGEAVVIWLIAKGVIIGLRQT